MRPFSDSCQGYISKRPKILAENGKTSTSFPSSVPALPSTAKEASFRSLHKNEGNHSQYQQQRPQRPKGNTFLTNRGKLSTGSAQALRPPFVSTAVLLSPDRHPEAKKRTLQCTPDFPAVPSYEQDSNSKERLKNLFLPVWQPLPGLLAYGSTAEDVWEWSAEQDLCQDGLAHIL